MGQKPQREAAGLVFFGEMVDLELNQIDVKIDFLNGELHEDICMQQPQ